MFFKDSTKSIKIAAAVIVSCVALSERVHADTVTTTTCCSAPPSTTHCRTCTKTCKKQGPVSMLLHSPGLLWDGMVKSVF